MSYGFPDNGGQVEMPQQPGRGPGLLLLMLIAAGVFFFMNSTRRPPTNSPLEPAGRNLPQDGRYIDDPPEGEVAADPDDAPLGQASPAINREDWSMDTDAGQPRKDNEVELKLQNQTNPDSGKAKSGDWELDTKPDGGNPGKPTGGGR